MGADPVWDIRGQAWPTFFSAHTWLWNRRVGVNGTNRLGFCLVVVFLLLYFCFFLMLSCFPVCSCLAKRHRFCLCLCLTWLTWEQQNCVKTENQVTGRHSLYLKCNGVSPCRRHMCCVEGSYLRIRRGRNVSTHPLVRGETLGCTVEYWGIHLNPATPEVWRASVLAYLKKSFNPA